MELNSIILYTCHKVDLLLKPKKKLWRPSLKKSKYYSSEFKRVSKQLRTCCSDCWATTLLQIHHKDFNKENNDLSNLVCLCYYCHSKFHPHMQNKNPPKWLK